MSEISFPLDDMSTTSQTLRNFLEDQWNQHTSLFLTNENSYSALLLGFASAIPNVGGQLGELAQELKSYHQQYYQCYQDLLALADMIDKAAQEAGILDQNITQSFNGF